MVNVMLAEGFEEIEALAVTDILRRAGIEARLVSATENVNVTGSHGITVNADITVSKATVEDVIFLPGGMPGTINLGKEEKVTKLITAHKEAGKILAAICAAPTVYGKMGLLKGKNATCYPGMEDGLTGAIPSNERVVTDGNIITSKGPGTSFELGYRLVEVLSGKEKAEELKKAMIFNK